MSQYRVACRHVLKRLTVEKVLLNVGRVDAAKRAELVVGNFLRSLFFVITSCASQDFARARVFLDKLSSIVLDILPLKENKHCDITSPDSSRDEGLLDICSVILS